MKADQPRALRCVFYGDDFTGSTDALEVLAFSGLRCALFLKPPTIEQVSKMGGFDALGVAGDSRGMSPDEMSESLPSVFRALHALNPEMIHYKVCSTFDSSETIGSIGRVLEIALDTGAAQPVPIVAGTPALQRYCLFGELFARSGTDGKIYRIDRHPIMRAHPVTPMDESDLIRFFARQTALPIVNFAYTQLEAPREMIDSAFDALCDTKQDAPAAVLFDTATPAHLTEIGRLLTNRSAVIAKTSAGERLFVIGSSGMEYALTQWWQAEGTLPDTLNRFDTVRAAAPVLTISGSASPLSALQIDAALDAGFYEIAIDSSRVVDDATYAAYLSAVTAETVIALRSGRHVMMHTAKGPSDPRIAAMLESLVARGKTRGEAKHLGGRLLGERLGQITEATLKACPVPRIVISGGDTSSRITQVLAPDALEIEARLTPGAPLCRVLSDKPHLQGLEIALKGGQMGHAAYFVDACRGTS